MLLIFFIVLSFNFVVATENTNDTLNYSEYENNGINEVSPTELDTLNAISNEYNLNEGNNDCKVIYVGTTGTDGGNGSSDNPFTTFKAASEAINGEDSVTINVFSGTYYLGEGLAKDANEPLKFNTNNLNIIGNGSVIIKNYFNDNSRGNNAEAFSLVSSSANFTFSNLVFDATDCNVAVLDMDGRYGPDRNFFLPFYGETALGVFDNCSFIGFAKKANEIIYGLDYNSIFRNCYFKAVATGGLFGLEEAFMEKTSGNSYIVDGFTLFENCVISIPNPTAGQMSFIRTTIKIPDWNISMNNVWLGQNNLPNWIHPATFWDSDHLGYDFVIPVNRYAIFNVTQNYLGNNTYEIIGKLTWNGTNDQDGMENFQPMTVKLVSDNGGELAPTATLVNGTFKTIYKNSASTHFITATLDNQDIELEFTTVNITSDPVSIFYGDDQNITVKLSQAINNNVTITVSNATYNKSYVVKVNDDSFTYTIPDRLKAGSYNINITLNNGTLFGFNTTTLTVSKVSDYKFEVVPSSNVKFGDIETITITLPDDVNGTVTVQFGNETQSLSAKPLMKFNFFDLKVTEYAVNVTYSGNDKYTFRSIQDSVTVNKADSDLEIDNSVFAYGEDIIIPFKAINANGVTVIVLNESDEEVDTTSSNSNIITLGTLPVGEYTLEITTVVDKEGNYDRITKFSKLTITKTTPSMKVIDETAENITVKDNITLKVKLPSDATGNVIIKGNGKKLYNVSANETITINISPVSGDYAVDIIYSGDKNYENHIESKEFIISKSKTSITANPIVFEEGNSSTIEVNIPDVDSGFILIEVSGKKFYADISGGKSTVLIDGLVAGNYTANIIFAGDELFDKATGTVDVNVTPAVDIISELKKTINDLNSTIESQAEKISGLNATVNNQTTIIESQVKVISGLNATVNNQSSVIESQKEQISNLNKQLAKLTVTKKKTIIKASNKVFKAKKKSKKISVTIQVVNQNGKKTYLKSGKKVTLKVKGKTYTAKVNKKGIAKFTIKLTKKGKYKAKIKFAGDDTYKASSKTIKIRIK